MKNSFCIEPMPGEPALAHQGRLALFLGIKTEKQFKELVRQHLPEGAADANSLSRLGQLAAISGMSLADYARQHSMLGVFRVVVPPKDWAPFGSSDDARYVRSQGMLIHKAQACLCPQCVKEDLDHWKFSWFRRSHQIEGVDWCPSHKVRLLGVTANDPWSKLPQHWVESGEVSEIADDRDCESEFEARYAEIGMSMLERAAPLSVQALASVLSERALALGLRRSRVGRRLNLSDLLRQTAPAQWLQAHWPEVSHKLSGDFVMALDRVISHKSYAQRGTSYLTAMATLWHSTLELHQALQQASAVEPAQVQATPRVHGNTVEFWQGAVWSAYLRCKGNVARMASDLGIDRIHLAARLPELGLVSVKRLPDSPRRRAFMRFEAGESLRKACEEEKADIDEVEALIRVSCARQATALRKIGEPRKSKPSVGSYRGRASLRVRSQEPSPKPTSVDCD